MKAAKDAVFEKRPEQAVTEYRQALALLDRQTGTEAGALRAKALKGVGDVYYLELRDFLRAVEAYRELLRSYPDAPESQEGRLYLAEVLKSHFRDLRGAITELTAAISHSASFPADRAYEVAKLYFELGDYRQCELEAKALVGKVPASPWADDALFLSGQALGMEGHKEAAAVAYRELAEKYAGSELAPHALFELGKLAAEGNRNEEAISLWVDALKAHPDPELVQRAILRARKGIERQNPPRIGDSAQAFDKRAHRTSVEAAGGTAEEAARERRVEE